MTVIVLALVILGALTTDAAAADPGPSLRDLINMVTPRLPAITKVYGPARPKKELYIEGWGFGSSATPGTVTLTLPGRAEKLDCSQVWSDQWLSCLVPAITGVQDTAASVRVTTATGFDLKEMPVAFVAEKEIIQVPVGAVAVSCSKAAGLDMCNPTPPVSVMGFHQDLNPTCNWASKTAGMDQYDLNLKNGWKSHSMTTTDLRTNLSTVKTASAGQTSFKVGWQTTDCWIGYIVNFRITGPKGVPFQ